MKKFILLTATILLVGAGCQTTPVDTGIDEGGIIVNNKPPIQETMNRSYTEFPGLLPEDQLVDRHVTIVTKHGPIEIDLFGDTAPLAVSNFIQLASDGYFNGLTFHRRDEGFVIQGGDPNGNGTGGPGYTFNDELTDDYTYDRGIVAMANRGPNTNGSQFFIMLADTPLPKGYTIFGRVTDGMDAVDAVKIGDVMESVNIR